MRPGLARVVAGRADDVLRDDLAATGRELPFAACRRARRRDFGLLVDLGARIAGGPSQRHRKVGGRDVPVVAGDTARRRSSARVRPSPSSTQRPQLLDLVGPMISNGTPIVFAVPQYLRYSSMRSRQVASRRLPVTWKLTSWPGLRRQALVEVDRVLVQLADRVAHVEERQQAGGMPGRAGGELGRARAATTSVQPLVRQVVERADSDHAAADHDHPSVRFHPRVLRPLAGVRSSVCGRGCTFFAAV